MFHWRSLTYSSKVIVTLMLRILIQTVGSATQSG